MPIVLPPAARRRHLRLEPGPRALLVSRPARRSSSTPPSARTGRCGPGSTAQTIGDPRLRPGRPDHRARSSSRAPGPATCSRWTCWTSSSDPYGWSANYPGAGLLPEDFPDPWLYVWDLTGARAPYVGGISVPIEPMVGIVGCTPAAPGVHTSIPPLPDRRQHGRQAHRPGDDRLPAGRGRGRALRARAIRMRRRVTARSAARGSRPR